MIDLDPEFRIYDPPLLLFGGVKIEPPHNPTTIADEIGKVLSDIADSLYQAYKVRSKTVSKNEQVIFRAWPIVAELDERCRDDYIGEVKIAQRILNLVIHQKKERALITHDNGFYLLNILSKDYDPVTTEALLKAAESAMFSFVGGRYKIESNIKDNVLRIDAQLIPPKGYIV